MNGGGVHRRQTLASLPNIPLPSSVPCRKQGRCQKKWGQKNRRSYFSDRIFLTFLSGSGGEFSVSCPKKRDFRKICKFHAIKA
jgi:hypothetical protein